MNAIPHKLQTPEYCGLIRKKHRSIAQQKLINKQHCLRATRLNKTASLPVTITGISRSQELFKIGVFTQFSNF